ncbi:CCA tRNA nucleotidyltransferase [Enterococcus sp.]|uniref:CCA tRNA nucleotidyltransferase n=1 Tax=Enterococcus sp. TaxID=35783 RepID=UPI0028A0FCEF|nr:CCA tRNA nucleotidyltransferase [Enterococcus sp.]
MKLNNLPEAFVQAAPLLQKIEEAGFEAYFVGGSVRDTILNQPIHDVDIATSAFPAEVKALFPRTIDIGIEHGTVLVLWEQEQYEITTFRTEAAYQDFRRPDKVDFVRSLQEDLKRRDFTINALALQKDGQIIDLFDGLADLDNQVLRAVGNPQERFHEDALRMMRGVRFVSQLGFELEARTFLAIQENHALLAKISVERVMIEFVKMLLGTHRNQALKAFVATECYQYCPGLRPYGEALLRMADLPALPLIKEEAAWVLLLDQLHLNAHEVRPFLKAWKCSNACIRQVQAGYQFLLMRKASDWTDSTLYQAGMTTIELVESLLPFIGQDGCLNDVEARYQALPIHQLQDLAVNGRDLLRAFDRPSGPWLKDVLQQLEASVVKRDIANQQEALLLFAQAYLEHAEKSQPKAK